jgi:hypothetical protein
MRLPAAASRTGEAGARRPELPPALTGACQGAIPSWRARTRTEED